MVPVIFLREPGKAQFQTVFGPEFSVRLANHAEPGWLNACSDVTTQDWSLVGLLATSFAVAG